MFKEGIWWRRKGVSKGGRIEKDGARRENDGRICAGVQKSGERKWIRRKAASRGVQARDEWRDPKEVDEGRKPTNLHRKLVQEGNSIGQELEGKSEGEREIARKERTGRRGSKAGAKTELATTLSVAKEVNASAGNNRACSDGRCGENKCGGCKRTRARYGSSS